MSDRITITWLGHACFKVEKAGFAVILDPYKNGSVPGLTDLRESANLILCSHEHDDHSGRECVPQLSEAMSPFTVTALNTFHDHHEGTKRGSNIMHILESEGCRIAHLGDLGCYPTPEQIEQLRGVQVLMIPVGGFFTIDGKEAMQLVKELQPEMVIPMHFRDDDAGFGYDQIDTVEILIKAAGVSASEQENTITAEYREEASVTISDIKGQSGSIKTKIVVLNPQNLDEGYVTFEITGKDGATHEMAVTDEFDFEGEHYVVAALVVDDTISPEGRYIYRSIEDGDDFTVEQIKKQFDYNRIAKAYMEME